MKISELREKLIGKKLNTIINLNITPENSRIVQAITGNNYDSLDALHLLIIEGELYLLFIDYDSDGYRSSDWHLAILTELLDKGNTNNIKNINSTIKDIQYIETNEDDGKHYIMLITDEYLIMMGQRNVNDYYPSNFIDIEEAKEFAVKEMQGRIKKGELIDCG